MSAKNVRDQLQVKHEGACRKLLDSTTGAVPSARRIKVDLAAVEKVKDKLIRAHVEYVSSIRGQVSHVEHSNFMRLIDMKHAEATDAAEQKLIDMGELEVEAPDAPPTRQVAWDKLVKEERIMKVEITAEIENCTLVVAERMTEEQRVVVEPMVANLEKMLREKYSKLRDDMAELATDEANDAAVVTAVEDFYKEAIPAVTKIRTQYILNLPRPVAAAPPPPQPVQQPGAAAAAARIQPELKALKFGAQTVPKFDGTARNYAMFRKFWKENVKVLYRLCTVCLSPGSAA